MIYVLMILLVIKVITDNIISGLFIHDITFIKVYGVLSIIIKINTFNTIIPNTVYMQMSASLDFLIKALQNFTILKYPEYTQLHPSYFLYPSLLTNRIRCKIFGLLPFQRVSFSLYPLKCTDM